MNSDKCHLFISGHRFEHLYAKIDFDRIWETRTAYAKIDFDRIWETRTA